MSEKEKTNKKLTRREFLKDAGLIAGGAALGSVALVNACGGTTTQTVTQTITKTTTAQGGNVTITKQAETSTFSAPPVTTTVTNTQTAPAATTTVTPPKTTVTAVSTLPKSGYIAWNQAKCMACGRCLMACAISHEKAVSPTLSSVTWQDEREFAGFIPRQPLFCQQCTSPDCYYACPSKDVAFLIDAKTGARYINRASCSGDGACVKACPLTPARIHMDPVLKKAIKCDLCKDRAGGPICVEICDRGALTLVKAEERV